MDKISLKLLLSSLNSSSSLSCSIHVRCSNPSVIFMAFCWTLSSVPLSLPCWGALNWTQHSRCASLHLMARSSQWSSVGCQLPLLQGCIAGSCLTWHPPGPPSPFLPHCFPGCWLPARCGAWGCSLSGQGSTLIFGHQQQAWKWIGNGSHLWCWLQCRSPSGQWRAGY